MNTSAILLATGSSEPKVKEEPKEIGDVLSPESAALVAGLPDTPDSRALKESLLQAKNVLHRGPWAWARLLVGCTKNSSLSHVLVDAF